MEQNSQSGANAFVIAVYKYVVFCVELWRFNKGGQAASSLLGVQKMTYCWAKIYKRQAILACRTVFCARRQYNTTVTGSR